MSQRYSLFRTHCTINGKICELLIDSGCTENITSRSAVQALQLQTMKNPSPYKISWVKRGVEIMVADMCRVTFSIGKNYICEVSCDFVDMDACHLILGRPWQFDAGITHDGRTNTYSLEWKGRKLWLLPHSPQAVVKTDKGKQAVYIISNKALLQSCGQNPIVYALVASDLSEVAAQPNLQKIVQDLLLEFADIAPPDLPCQLPHLRSVQHQIDFTPGATIPHLPHYKMSPHEHTILQDIVDELLQKQLIQHSLSPCAVPALFIPKKDGK
ncbi:uncharacterized protein LOC110111734 [Dendrobium catenatum]|uniref:uncharacterized protein LOC110111734 n=1 Tax=Dendrobium catenatum TaxID=906689 RepID=UPI00109EF026|nr:uncharacterized protein LOC110111734 [Dendrobium catenatum]